MKTRWFFGLVATMFALTAILFGVEQRGRQPQRDPNAAPPMVTPGDPCSTGETPCTPGQPWMRGNTEKSCARLDVIAAMRKADPGRVILACACRHMCDVFDKTTGEADGAKWDPLCEARCNPRRCTCRNPCDTE